MKEILFRGKKIDGGDGKCQFVYGSYVEYGNSQSVIIEKGEYGENHSHEVDLSTVVSYTGVTDKNGVKIFEGDRVIVPMYRTYNQTPKFMKGTVEWRNGAFHVTWDKEVDGRHFLGYLNDVEVIEKEKTDNEN